MKPMRLDLNTLHVATFDTSNIADKAAPEASLGGGTGICYTCRPTICQETRAEI